MQQDNKFIAEPYEDKVRGLNLTPEQDKELRELYNRSVIPARPYMFSMVGLTVIDMVCSINAVSRVVETKDWTAFIWFAAFIMTQIGAGGTLVYRMGKAEKQLNDKIQNIKNKTR